MKVVERLKEAWKRLPKLMKAAIMVFVIALASILGGSVVLQPSSPPVIEPETPPVGATTSTNLWVNDFDNRITGSWELVGLSPYLNASDFPDAYVNCTANLDEIGDWHFQDLPAEATSVVNVTIYVRLWEQIWPLKFEVHLWDGTSWVYVGDADTGGTKSKIWTWWSLNVTSTLDTVDKVNNVEMKLITNAYGTYESTVDAAHLEVFYETAEPPQCTQTAHNTTIIGEPVLFSSYWTGTNLSHAIFGWNATGSWVNDTIVDPWSGAPSEGWFNVSKTLPVTVKTIGYRFYVNDTVGWGDSGIKILEMTSGIPTAKSTLNVTDFTPYSSPPFWYLLLKDVSFQGAGAWVVRQNSTTSWIGRWIKISDIEAITTTIRGYEVDVLNKSDNTWATPTSIYSYCGGTNPSNITDDDTTTYWECTTAGHTHEIVLDMGTDIRTDAIQIYCAGDAYSNWTGVDVYVAPSTGWFTNGTSPYLNASDYPDNHIYCVNSESISAPLDFETTKRCVKTVWAIINASATSTPASIKLQIQNGTSWFERSVSITSTGWQIYNVTIKENFVDQWFIDDIALRFVGNSGTEVRIDHVYLQIEHIDMENVEKILTFAAYGKTVVRYKTDKTHALYFGYVDGTDGLMKVVAYDLLNMAWTDTYTIMSYDPDPHYAPSIGVFPNGSLVIVYGYLATYMKYRYTTLSTKGTGNLTAILTSWTQNDTDIPFYFQDASYPQCVVFDDRLVVFVRGNGGALSGSLFQLTFKDGQWSRKEIFYFDEEYVGEEYHSYYGRAFKEDGKLYWLFRRRGGGVYENATVKYVCLIVSEDKGETWKHWNGTVLTTPFEATQTQIIYKNFTYATSIWTDEDGKTCIIYQKYIHPTKWNMSDYSHNAEIWMLRANGTVPNPLSWTDQRVQDEYGNNLTGTCSGFFDTEHNKTTLWIGRTKSHLITRRYPIKYLRIKGEPWKYRRFYVYTRPCLSAGFLPIQNWIHPFERTTGLMERAYIGCEQALPNQFHPNRTWTFRYIANRSGRVTHVAIRVNISTSNYEAHQYWVAVYNDSGLCMAKSYEGEVGTYGVYRAGWWDTFPLNQSVYIEKDKTYWIAVSSSYEEMQIYYKETAEQDTCRNYYQNIEPPENLSQWSYNSYNRTASLFLVSYKRIFMGIWYRPFAAITMPTYATHGNVTFACKWLDAKGLVQGWFYSNSSGTWQLENSTSFGEVTSAWHNVTLSITNETIECVTYEFVATSVLGKQTSTGILYCYFYTPLQIGWNNVTAWSADVGHTLLDVNASLHLNSVNFTVITFEYPNGTQVSLVWIQETNDYWVESTTMTVTSDTQIWIYCNEEGKWYHKYGA